MNGWLSHWRCVVCLPCAVRAPMLTRMGMCSMMAMFDPVGTLSNLTYLGFPTRELDLALEVNPRKEQDSKKAKIEKQRKEMRADIAKRARGG